MSSFWQTPANTLIPAAILFAIMVGDILLAKIQVMLGNSAPVHLGDTAQFALLLLAVILFVSGTIQKENIARKQSGKKQ